MAEISGVQGSVLANGVALEASEWSVSRKAAVIDRSNFTTGGEPLNAAGQRTGDVSVSGPVSTTSNLALKGITEGALVVFRMRATPNLWLDQKVRISQIDANDNKDNGPNWSIQGSRYGPSTVVGI